LVKMVTDGLISRWLTTALLFKASARSSKTLTAVNKFFIGVADNAKIRELLHEVMLISDQPKSCHESWKWHLRVACPNKSGLMALQSCFCSNSEACNWPQCGVKIGPQVTPPSASDAQQACISSAAEVSTSAFASAALPSSLDPSQVIPQQVTPHASWTSSRKKMFSWQQKSKVQSVRVSAGQGSSVVTTGVAGEGAMVACDGGKVPHSSKSTAQV